MTSQINDVSVVCPAVCSGADQRKHQSSAPLAFVGEIHWSPVNSPNKRPVARKMFPFDDVIMTLSFESEVTEILWHPYKVWMFLLLLLLLLLLLFCLILCRLALVWITHWRLSPVKWSIFVKYVQMRVREIQFYDFNFIEYFYQGPVDNQSSLVLIPS